MSLENPAFNGESYIAYPPLQDVGRSTMMEVVLRPSEVTDSIITYVGESQLGTGDYLALLIKDGYV